MPRELECFEIQTGFPIACITITQASEIVLGGGGGSGRSGVKNKLAVYTISASTKTFEAVSSLVLSSDEDAPTCVAQHPKDKTLVASVNASKKKIEAGENNNCRLFELKKKSIRPGKSAASVASTNELDYQRCIDVDPHGKLVAGGSTNGTLAVMRYPQLTPAFPFVEASGEINDVSFNASGKWLAVATDSELRVVVSRDGSAVQSIEKPHTTSGVRANFRFARFGRAKGTLNAFHSTQKSPVELTNVLYTVLNTKSRKQAYVALWDTTTWKRLGTRPVCNSVITTMALSNNGKLLAFATASLQIVICDAHSLRVLMRIPGAHAFAITALAFTNDDCYLVSGSADESCHAYVIPDKWPTAFTTIAESIMANLQLVIMLLVLLLGITAALIMRS
ncbi:hypothetical protein GGI07_004406 [Coemansia sp. Benny D115]|nr:hypothetical protein GGI07_004406 [Coemansia sp. Benny D115]